MSSNEKEKKKINNISKTVYENVIIAVAIMLYFIVINFAYNRLQVDIVFMGLKIVSMVIMLISILVFEIAYNKDSGKIAITGIEVLVLSAYTLSISYMVQATKMQFPDYIIISSYIFVIYYILKSIIIYTKERKKYLKSLSDIHEILNDEPVKKEAKKRKNKKNN